MNFLKRIMFKKVSKKAVQVLIAFLLARGIDETLNGIGITIDWNQFELYLSGSLFLVIEGLRNWLKVKHGWKWL